MLGSPTITVKGRNLLAKIVAANIPLTLSNIGLGDGLQEENEEVIGLVNEIMKKEIESCEYNEKEGQYYIRRVFTNAELEEGFYIREVGIYAIDPDEGEILYAYTNAGETGVDYFAPGKGKVIVKEIIEMATKFGNAENITVIIDPSTALVTEQEFEDYKNSNKTDINNLQKQITSNDEDIAQLSNPNLLINGGLKINQRNKSEYTENLKYTVDRWRLINHNGSLDVDEGKLVVTDEGIMLTGSTGLENTQLFVQQLLEEKYCGKTVTVSCDIKLVKATKGSLFIQLADYLEEISFGVIAIDYTDFDDDYKHIALTCTIPNKIEKHLTINIGTHAGIGNGTCNPEAEIHIRNAKLEIGDKATPFYPRSYGEELALCQRYYQCLNGNKVSYPHFGNIMNVLARNDVLLRSTLSVPLRIIPTVILIGNIRIDETTTDISLIKVDMYSVGTNVIKLAITAAQEIPAGAHYVEGNGVDSNLILDAEIY